MKILSVETSCDETSAAVVEKNDGKSVRVLSNVTATSLAIHAATGGIIPENAAREQVKYIIPVIVEALLKSENVKPGSNSENFIRAKQILNEETDALAVTYGPGLIGSLLVGVETAKTLSLVFDKPIIPVNHLLAHLFANFIQTSNIYDPRSEIKYPFIGLIVSGGHTDLLLFKSLTDYEWLGGTRDDAAGEALDKIGRLLNLPYPAGPEIERRSALAKDSDKIKFKSPLMETEDFDFSFSGLKAEVSRFVKNEKLTNRLTNQVSRAVQTAIFDVLIKKTIRAAKVYGCSNIVLGGGVASNKTLLRGIELGIRNNELGIKVFAPEKVYATDNAAMIGSYALLNYKPVDWHKVAANPDLYFV